jgi:hypothetical protein
LSEGDSMSIQKKADVQPWRISEAVRDGDSLSVRFADGATVTVPLAKISPAKGKPDWSRISIQLKGGHIAVPVVDGDYPEHEVPWDVLRWFIKPV